MHRQRFKQLKKQPLYQLFTLTSNMSSNPINQPTVHSTRSKTSRKRSLSDFDQNIQTQIESQSNKKQRLSHNQQRQTTESQSPTTESQTIESQSPTTESQTIESQSPTTESQSIVTVQIPNDNNTDCTNSALPSSNPIQSNENSNNNNNYKSISSPSMSNQIQADSHNHNNNYVSKVLPHQVKDKTSSKKFTKLDQITRWDAAAFQIKVKCTHVSDKQFTSTRKPWFYVIIMDEEMTERKFNFWSDVCEKHYDKMKKGSVYEINRVQTRCIKSELYRYFGEVELTCTPSTVITAVSDDNLAKLPQKWNFIASIMTIHKQTQKAIFDVIGIVSEWEEVDIVNTKRGPSKVRRLKIYDETGIIEISLWGESTRKIWKKDQIVAFKNCRISTFNGFSLTLLSWAETEVVCPRAHQIRQWLLLKHPVLKMLYAKLPCLSDGVAKIEDYSKIKPTTVQIASKVRRDYQKDQTFPDQRLIKIQGIIAEITRKPFFHSKRGKSYWSLRIDIKDFESENTVEAICFEEVGKQIMNGWSGDQAAKLQRNNSQEFAKLMKQMTKKEQKREFSMRCKESSNPHSGKKELDLVIDAVQNC